MNVIIADNQDITKEGLKSIIPTYIKNPTLFFAEDKKQLLEKLVSHPDALVILDYTLFDFTGIENLSILGIKYPCMHCILFCEELSADFIIRAAAEQFISLISKDCTMKEISNGIKSTSKGIQFICEKFSSLLVKRDNIREKSVLTPSERDILRLIASGKTNKEIAEERHSSINTITTHRKNIFRKISVNNVLEASKYAVKAGIVNPSDYYI